jgi:hypothetical protein
LREGADALNAPMPQTLEEIAEFLGRGNHRPVEKCKRCTDIIPATPCEQSAWRAVGPLTDSLPRAVSYPAVAVRAFAKPLGSWSRRKRAAARSPPQ